MDIGEARRRLLLKKRTRKFRAKSESLRANQKIATAAVKEFARVRGRRLYDEVRAGSTLKEAAKAIGMNYSAACRCLRNYKNSLAGDDHG